VHRVKIRKKKTNTKISKLWVRTGYEDLHGELGVVKDREQSGDAGDDEGHDDGGAGVLFGLEASEDEHAGANDRSYANLVLASSLDLHELRVVHGARRRERV
jgi:hypothetical protein